MKITPINLKMKSFGGNRKGWILHMMKQKNMQRNLMEDYSHFKKLNKFWKFETECYIKMRMCGCLVQMIKVGRILHKLVINIMYLEKVIKKIGDGQVGEIVRHLKMVYHGEESLFLDILLNLQITSSYYRKMIVLTKSKIFFSKSKIQTKRI